MSREAVLPAKNKELDCGDIMCLCDAPVFDTCQKAAGITTIAVPGLGLWCCCCYGPRKRDCCAVFWSGVAMTSTIPIGYGCVIGCVVGMKMLGCVVESEAEGANATLPVEK